MKIRLPSILTIMNLIYIYVYIYPFTGQISFLLSEIIFPLGEPFILGIFFN